MELTKERKIILVIGAAVLIIGALYRYSGNESVVQVSGNETEIKERQVAKYRHLIANKDSYIKQKQQLTGIRELFRERLLNGNTPVLAAVDIQNTLNEISRISGVAIDNIKVMKAETNKDGIFTNIPLQFNAAGSVRALKNMLEMIESSPKLLFIREARIYLPNTNKFDQLKGSFTVVGLMEQEAGHAV